MTANSIKRFSVLALLLVISAQAFAIEASKVPEDRQSATGLYFTSLEASNYVARHARSTLFLDIRDPVEIFTVGMPTAVDHNVTFKYVDPTAWDAKKETFAMKGNPDFVKGVDAQLKAKGLTRSNRIILICGSGKRAAKAATALKKAGFPKVYSVVDGYAAWQKDNLPWSRKLAKDKVMGQ
jgi:rhodanese-related sulfurtransferase